MAVPFPAKDETSDFREDKPQQQDATFQTLEFMAGVFFDDSNLKTLTSALSSRRDQRRHMLTAAAKLMSAYGVHMTAEEQEALLSMNEADQINALVAKLPSTENSQFQPFFPQLQRLVLAFKGFQAGLEAGEVSSVENVLYDTMSLDIAPIILRMAVVQAGTET